MAVPYIQNKLFDENKPTNEYLAYSALWEFFFQEHKLMLLNSQMDDILKEADKFRQTFNGKSMLKTDKVDTNY